MAKDEHDVNMDETPEADIIESLEKQVDIF